MATIQKTQDYNLFKRIGGNRRINKSHVSKLILSYSENPNLFEAAPIIVNSQMEIIDGQHRLEAAKKLEQNIYYITVDGLGLPEIQKLNSATKTWSPIDYAQSFSEKGNKNYQTYLDFKAEFHLTHEILTSYLAITKGATPITFRNGSFKVENVQLSKTLCSQLVEIQEFHKKGDTKKFAFAFKAMALHPKYDHKKMLHKAKLYGATMFKDAANPQDYMRQLEDIYNFHNRVKESMIKIF